MLKDYSEQHRFFSLFRISVICLFIIAFDIPVSLAGKWKTVAQPETPILLTNWPNDIRWIFRDGGSTPNYAADRWVALGKPSAGYETKNQTIISVLYLNAGYYWDSGITGDVRERLQKRAVGFHGPFAGAEWESGQKFECYADRSCNFRVLKFKVGGEECQWVFDNPDLDTTDPTSGRSRTPWAVEIIHCGTAIPFQKDHFKRTEKTIQITYPGATNKVASPKTSAAISSPATPKTETRPVAVQWEGKAGLIAGEVEIPSRGAGKIRFTLSQSGGRCSGNFAYNKPGRGVWSAACSSGETASGTFQTLGSGRGATGEGTDNTGRSVKFTIGEKK